MLSGTRIPCAATPRLALLGIELTGDSLFVDETPGPLAPVPRHRRHHPAVAARIELDAHHTTLVGQPLVAPIASSAVSRKPAPPIPRRVHAKETEPPRNCGAFTYAPKRTRTSTRLSRTRPSTWRVYQFRHRREGTRE